MIKGLSKRIKRNPANVDQGKKSPRKVDCPKLDKDKKQRKSTSTVKEKVTKSFILKK